MGTLTRVWPNLEEFSIKMEYSINKTSRIEKTRTDCLVLPIFEGKRVTATFDALDKQTQEFLSTILKKGDIQGKANQILLIPTVPHAACDRIVFIGLGKEEAITPAIYRDAIRKVITLLTQTACVDAIFTLSELSIKDKEPRTLVREAIEIIEDVLYSSLEFKTDKTSKSFKQTLKRISFTIPSKRDLISAEKGLEEGEALAKGIQYAKYIGNLPPNICTPNYLAKEAQKLAKNYSNLHAAVLNEKDIQALKMGALWAVGKGSLNPPRLITLQYQGKKDKSKPIVFVGKGITFDTGGNSIKPPANMIGQKYDMCGGAAVLGILLIAAQLKLPLNIVGCIASAENMPGANATRPDDIITSLSGKTIEVLNTDAEGRLVLCDALTYCERFNPELVIDIATLTSGCIATFGGFVSAMFSNNDSLAEALLVAGQKSSDKCWRLPIFPEYQDGIASPIADMANISGVPEAPTIISACFLSRFTENFVWAHLDIAGTASKKASTRDRTATGRPLPLLLQFLLDKVQQKAN